MIAWVKVVKVREPKEQIHPKGTRNVRYEVRILETLKGRPRKRLLLSGRSDTEGDHLLHSTRDDHKHFTGDTVVGSSGTEGGRVSEGCNKRAPPDLLVGGKYLVFLGGAPDTKDFERVESNGDKWLNAVRSEVVKQGFAKLD